MRRRDQPSDRMHASLDVLCDGLDASVPLATSAVPHAQIDPRPGVAVVTERDRPGEKLARHFGGALTFESGEL
jgi:hypothetical protein